MGTMVTYCAKLDKFLCARFEISLERQNNNLVCLNLRVPSSRPLNKRVKSQNINSRCQLLNCHIHYGINLSIEFRIENYIGHI